MAKIRLKQIEAEELEDFIVNKSVTGLVLRPSDTGNFIDTYKMGQTGHILWARDASLSGTMSLATGDLYSRIHLTGAKLESLSGQTQNYFSSLSGNLVATGGIFNQTGLNLYNRDVILSNNLAILSGIEANDVLVLSNNVALISGGTVFTNTTGNFLTVSDSGNMGGGLNTQSGIFLFNRDVSLSGSLVSTGSVFNQTGLNLFNRDIQLSNNLNNLSGNIVFKTQTGGFLDLSSYNILNTQDIGLSDNIASLSGAVTFSSQTGLFLTTADSGNIGGDLTHVSGSLLFDRDTELSSNLALVSGQGGWDHASGAILWNRDESLSGSFNQTGFDLLNRDEKLSEGLVSLSGSVVFKTETGGYLDLSDYTSLNSQDIGLSDSIVALSGIIGVGDVTQEMLDSLSGNLVATGGVFNTSGLNLWNRDLGLSSNISILSGAVVFSNQTGSFLTTSDSGNIGGDLTHASGDLLWNRDEGLSASIIALSGIIPASINTGGLLDLADQTALELRDSNLSSNVALISGLIGGAGVPQATVDSLSGNLVATGGIFNQTGLSLFNRDLNLSLNVATLSGNIVFKNQTGGYLDLTSQTALQLRDTNLSTNVASISGNITTQTNRLTSLSGSLGQTGLILWNREAGLSASIADLSGSIGGGDVSTAQLEALSGSLVATGDIFNTSGLNLFNRDLGLSSNIAALSGSTVFSSNTGGFLDLADEIALQLRDTNLSTNVAIISGSINLQTNRITSLSGSLISSGLTLWNRDQELSSNITLLSGAVVFSNTTGFLATKDEVNAASAGVSSINSESGILTFVGSNGINISTEENGNFIFSGSLDAILSLSGNLVASGLTFNQTGLTLWNRDVGLSSNLSSISGSVVFKTQTGGYLDLASGTTLQLRDANLSSNVALVSGNVASNTSNIILQANKTTSLTGSLNQTGSLLWIRDAGLSASITALSGIIPGTISTGGFLDNASGKILWDRDLGLGSSLNSLSGLVVFKSATGDLLDLADLEALDNQDIELSSNIAALSGIAIKSSQTGGYLDLADEIALQLRDTNLSSNVALISGDSINRDIGLSFSIADLSGTLPGVIDTGGLLDHASGKILWDRDLNLSSNISTLSGNIVFKAQTGGFLDLSDQTALQLRDTNLSSNVALISGNTVSNGSNITLQTNRITSLSGSLGQTGLILWNRDSSLSANVASLSGSVATNSSNITIQDNRTTSLTGSMNATGLSLYNRDIGLSAGIVGVSGNVNTNTTNITLQTNRITSLTGSLNSSGSLLWSRDIGLSNSIAQVSGLIGVGYVTQPAIDSLSGNVVASGEVFNSSGLNLFNRDLSLSSNVATISGTVSTNNTNSINRDNELSSNIAALSGVSVLNSETGGFLDLSDDTALRLRDTNLSSNVAILSGNILTNSSNVTLQSNRTTSLSGSLNSTGLALFNRDLQLSNNVATLSGTVSTNNTNSVNRDIGLSASIADLSGTIPGVIYTGGLLDLADETALELRDTNLSNNVASISGNIATNTTNITTQTNRITSLTGSLNYSGSLLWIRDAGLSSNIAALSGVSVFTSNTGGLLDLASQTALQLRDSNLSNNVASISGNVSTNASNIITQANRITSLTGSLNSTGLTLFNRDVSLSSNVATLSGTVTTNNSNSVTRDQGLSFSIADLSGTIPGTINTGGLLDHASGKTLWDRDANLSSNIATLSGTVSTNSSNITTQTNRTSSLSGSLNNTGLSLFNRDLILSNNIAALSGISIVSSQTGGFLDLADETALQLRDTNLSSNVATLSGNIVFKTQTGGYLDLSNQTALQLRDSNLSANVALISGNVSTNSSSITTQSNRTTSLSGSLNASGLNLFNRDLQLSNNIAALSGIIPGTINTGGLLDLEDQANLELRDTNLSNNVATLSGNIVFKTQTGGYLDLASQTALQLRDTNLSTNVASISGNVSTNASNITTQSNRVTSLSGSLNSSGLALFNRDLQLSNNVNTLSGTVSTNNTNSINRDNGLSSNIAALSGISLLSSQTGGFLDLADETALQLRDTNLSANVASISGNVNTNSSNITTQTNRITSLSGSMNSTGLSLFNRDLQLSSNISTLSGNVVFKTQTGGYLDLSDQTSLQLRDTNLSSNVATLSGTVSTNNSTSNSRDTALSAGIVGVSGNVNTANTNITTQTNRITSLTGSMNSTGLSLWNRDKVLSDNLAAISGLVGSPVQTIDLWTTAETLTDAYNNRYILLSAGTAKSPVLPNGLTVGFQAYFMNINDGDWTFTATSSLRDLYDNSLTDYVLARGNLVTMTLESGNNWRAIGDNYDENATGTFLFNRDVGLSQAIATVSGSAGWNTDSGVLLWNRDLSLSGNVTTQTNRITSLTGSMNSTGLSLWNREKKLSDNLALVSGLAGGSIATELLNSDVNLYRSSANIWSTDDSLAVNGTYLDGRTIRATGGAIGIHRYDTSNEGGQLEFNRASDNLNSWIIDAYQNNLRIWRNSTNNNGSDADLQFTLGVGAQMDFSFDNFKTAALNGSGLTLGMQGTGFANYQLHVKANTSHRGAYIQGENSYALDVFRNTFGSTTSTHVAARFMALVAGSPSDNFGPSIVMGHATANNGGTENNYGIIRSVRTNADDDTGAIYINTFTNGSIDNGLYIDQGTVYIQENLNVAGTIAGTFTNSIWVPANAMTPTTTNGAAAGTVETTTNKVMIDTLNFDTATQEYAQFEVKWPNSIKTTPNGSITFQYVWSHPSTTTNFGVAFQLEHIPLNNSSAIDGTSWSSLVTTVDTGGTTDDIWISPISSALAINTSTGPVAKFRVSRAVSNGSDNMAVDARLHGVLLTYDVTSLSDA